LKREKLRREREKRKRSGKAAACFWSPGTFTRQETKGFPHVPEREASV
jgi:hypothetical protein